MLWPDVEEKFRMLTRGVLAAQQQQQIVDAVLALASGDVYASEEGRLAKK